MVGTDEYVSNGHHDHHGDAELIEDYRFISECKRRAANEVVTFRAIFNNVLVM